MFSRFSLGKKPSPHQIIGSDLRIRWMVRIIYLMTFVLIVKLFFIQVVNGAWYRDLANGQHELFKTLFPQRGQILAHDRSSAQTGDLFPLATNKDYKLVYTDPRLVIDPVRATTALQPILQIPYDELFAKLSKTGDPYEILKKKLNEDEVIQIEALQLPGIKFQKETYRFYPEKNIGANIIGFVGEVESKKIGQYGIEGYFDEKLRGSDGQLMSERDLSGNWIGSTARIYQPAIDGSDIVLSIDRNIQYQACKALNEGGELYEADAGALVIMDPFSGKILAMCSWPDFDPNIYNQVESVKVYNNTVIFEPYEPGSIFKPITMSAAIDSGVVTPDTEYIDTGEVKIDRFTIRNSDKLAHGRTNMVEVLNKSLNLGMIFVVKELGTQTFKKYLENYGVGQLTGITLDRENKGNIASLSKPGDIYSYTASFGQGITTTPIELAQAMSVIANGGYLVKPYIVDEIRSKDYTEVTQTKVIRKVLDERTSILVGGMMASVIKFGYGKLAQVPGYTVAGKTGTAQIPDFENGGYSNKTNHSFLGFAPVENPAFVMMIKYENPQKGNFAESTAAPVFGRVAKYVLNYLKIPPDDK